MRAPDLDVALDIARPTAEVRAWWTQMPADYRAKDPREQPHRIVTRSRDARTWRIDTYWRLGWLPSVRIPETFTFREDGWDVDIKIPGGIGQRDEFTLSPTPTGTRVAIRVWMHARSPLGRLTLAPYRGYARRNFPSLWRGAGRLCERDAPRLGPSTQGTPHTG